MAAEKLSPFRMGWMLVMFDLPVLTKAQRKAATRFRESLLEDGFFMVQYSVYTRACPTTDRLEKHTARLHSMIPPAGNVRVLFLTDVQWTRGLNLSGPDYGMNHPVGDITMPEQIEFW